jgi:hypothetical protein
MTIGIFGSTDQTLRPHTRAYVIYDKATGEVLHVHRSVSFPKSPPPPEGPEIRARRLARNVSANADVIEVEEHEINQRQPVRVDVAKRRLVAIKASTIGKSKTSDRSKPSSSRRRASVKKSKRRKR